MKRKSARLTIQKRSFLLFEILMALALIALCLYPLVKPHTCMRRAEIKYLEEMQLERFAQEAFCKLKEKLYKNKPHSWNELTHTAAGELGTYQMMYPNGVKEIACSYQIEKNDECAKTSFKKTGLVIDISLIFTFSAHDQRLYQRTLFLERHNLGAT